MLAWLSSRGRITIILRGLILEFVGSFDEHARLLSRLLSTDLLVPHVVVAALLCEELVVCTALGDHALVEDEDLVGVGDCGETVTIVELVYILEFEVENEVGLRNNKHRASFGQLSQRLLNMLLSLRIQGRRRLIQHNNARILEDSSGNSNTLLLTTT